MKLTPRELVFLALLFAIPLGMWFFVLKPRNKSIKELELDSTKKEQTLQTLQLARLSAEKRLTDESSELEQTMSRMQQRLPEPGDSSKILDDISQEVSRLNLVQKIYTPYYPIKAGKRDDVLKVAVLPISLQLEGSFSGIYQFLQKLEKDKRIIHIDQLHIERLGADTRGRGGKPSASGTAEGQSGKVSASFEMLIFFNPDKVKMEVKDNGPAQS